MLLGMLMAAAPATAPAMGGHPAPEAPRLNGSHALPGPETLLIKTLIEIKDNRLQAALTEIDKVLRAYPNFRLAHLIKGDLLLARARPLTTIGDAPDAPPDRLADLRDEARVRLARYQLARPPAGRVPEYLLQLQPEQKHALVVDTSKSTLYVFENRNGKPHYVADYYITIGKNGFNKFREGDNKTPLGVYHVTKSLPRDELNVLYGKSGDLYGAGAFPINYPNEWDRRQGRNGYGIWLHGTPSNTFSRPPRASNGCVVLTNRDLEAITHDVQVDLTPIIISSSMDWVSPDTAKALRDDIARNVEAWRRDWESLDTGKYLRHYAANFSTGGMNLARWSEQKRKVNAGKTWVKVRLDGMSMFLYPDQKELAVVTFDQDYTSSNLSNHMRKRQYWIKESGGWKIIYEGAA